MNRTCFGAAALLLSLHGVGAETLTVRQIQAVISATDAAASQRDTQGIGRYLSRDFEKTLEVPDQKRLASVRINKQNYLALIDNGWDALDAYSYRREDTVIRVAADGQSGESASTITETSVVAGETMISRIREYAYYALEDGRPVITRIDSHTLVGDTTPAPGQ